MRRKSTGPEFVEEAINPARIASDLTQQLLMSGAALDPRLNRDLTSSISASNNAIFPILLPETMLARGRSMSTFQAMTGLSTSAPKRGIQARACGRLTPLV